MFFDEVYVEWYGDQKCENVRSRLNGKQTAKSEKEGEQKDKGDKEHSLPAGCEEGRALDKPEALIHHIDVRGIGEEGERECHYTKHS